MLKRRRTWLAGLLIAATAVLGGVALTTPAYAGSGNQICNQNSYCLNAWNGGPYVKSEIFGAVNNDFTLVSTGACNGGITTSTCPGHGIAAGQGIVGLKFTGSGGWVGRCIGDASNDPNLADSSLDTCPTGTTSGGYGTNIVWDTHNTCGSGYVILYDIHWNGYIRVADNNGSTVYLNNSSGSCLQVRPAA